MFPPCTAPSLAFSCPFPQGLDPRPPPPCCPPRSPHPGFQRLWWMFIGSTRLEAGQACGSSCPTFQAMPSKASCVCCCPVSTFCTGCCVKSIRGTAYEAHSFDSHVTCFLQPVPVHPSWEPRSATAPLLAPVTSRVCGLGRMLSFAFMRLPSTCFPSQLASRSPSLC